MYILRIEYPVPNFHAWKEAFDNDPIGRERSGVHRYRILRAIDDPNYVTIDLGQCERGRSRCAELAVGPRRVMHSPQARIVETVEIKEY